LSIIVQPSKANPATQPSTTVMTTPQASTLSTPGQLNNITQMC